MDEVKNGVAYKNMSNEPTQNKIDNNKKLESD